MQCLGLQAWDAAFLLDPASCLEGGNGKWVPPFETLKRGEVEELEAWVAVRVADGQGELAIREQG